VILCPDPVVCNCVAFYERYDCLCALLLSELKMLITQTKFNYIIEAAHETTGATYVETYCDTFCVQYLHAPDDIRAGHMFVQ